MTGISEERPASPGGFESDPESERKVEGFFRTLFFVVSIVVAAVFVFRFFYPTESESISILEVFRDSEDVSNHDPESSCEDCIVSVDADGTMLRGIRLHVSGEIRIPVRLPENPVLFFGIRQPDAGTSVVLIEVEVDAPPQSPEVVESFFAGVGESGGFAWRRVHLAMYSRCLVHLTFRGRVIDEGEVGVSDVLIVEPWVVPFREAGVHDRPPGAQLFRRGVER